MVTGFLAAPVTGDPGALEENRIFLDGFDTLRLPNLVMTVNGTNTTYPHHSLPVCQMDVNLSGQVNCTPTLAGQTVTLDLVKLDPSDLALGSSEILKNPVTSLVLTLNETGCAPFTMPPPPSAGIYALYAADVGSEIIAATTAMVVEAKIAIDTPERVFPGQAIDVEILIQNRSVVTPAECLYGAVLLFEDDYEETTVTLSGNGSFPGSYVNVTMGGRSAILSDPKISMNLLLNVLTTFPEESAAGTAENNGSSANLYLITDRGWTQGRYILTCGAYTPGRGLVGLGQKVLEITDSRR